MNAENLGDFGGRQFRHLDITRRIVGVFFEVYGELGYGFLESIYRAAMTIALREAGLLVEPEIELEARFRGRSVGAFRADLLIERVVVVELKVARAIDSAHIAQLLNYLRCTALETGLILNFGPRPQIRRLIFTNDRKNPMHAEDSQ
jgi:GxxExxY protein